MDFESFYHLWEATVALNAMCVRAGKRGTATGLGGYSLSITHADVYLFGILAKTADLLPSGVAKSISVDILNHSFIPSLIEEVIHTTVERI